MAMGATTQGGLSQFWRQTETWSQRRGGDRPATQSPAQEGAKVVGNCLIPVHDTLVSAANFLPPNIARKAGGPHSGFCGQ